MSAAAPTRPISIKDWTPEQKREVLVALAQDLFARTAKRRAELHDDSDRPVALLIAAFDTSKEYGHPLTPDYMFELMRRAATPENSIPWREMLTLLDEDDGAESRK